MKPAYLLMKKYDKFGTYSDIKIVFEELPKLCLDYFLMSGSAWAILVGEMLPGDRDLDLACDAK